MALPMIMGDEPARPVFVIGAVESEGNENVKLKKPHPQRQVDFVLGQDFTYTLCLRKEDILQFLP